MANVTFRPNKPTLRVERDRSTGEWLVTRYHRHGWNVLARFDDLSEAHKEAEAITYHANVVNGGRS